MAFMLPEQVESFKTEGEGRFYRFLATVAKPDHSYLAWYTPDLQGKEPDFILYSDSVGLIVFEVKDWALHQIREADPSGCSNGSEAHCAICLWRTASMQQRRSRMRSDDSTL
jgi:hypothetical protein